MDIARTSAIGLTVFITHLILLIALFHVLTRSIVFFASSALRTAIRAFSVEIGVPVSTGRGSGEGETGSREVE